MEKQNSEQLKQLNMRVPPEVKDAYQAFCDREKCTQPEGVGLLLSRLDARGDGNSDRNDQVAAFRHNMANLLALYEGSLVLAEDAKDVAREEYAVKLDQNAATIDALTGTVKDRDSEIHELKKSLDAAIENRDKALQKVEAIEQKCSSLQGQLEEKTQRICEMTEAFEKTKSLPQRCNDLLEENKRLLEANGSLMEDKRRFQAQLAEVERNADREQAKLRADWYEENQAHIAELMRAHEEKHALDLQVARLERELELAKLAVNARKDEATN